MSTDIEKAKHNRLATMDLRADAGRGGEELSAEDIVVPIISILQKMSPQVDKTQDAFIPGAEAGLFFDTTGDRLLGPHIEFVPVYKQSKHIKWKSRELGGGFLGYVENLDELDNTIKDGGKYVLPNGDTIVPTTNIYILLLEGSKATPAVLSLSSTQLTEGKKFLTRLATTTLEDKDGQYPAPFYAFKYKASTRVRSNTSGSWFVINFEDAVGPTDPELVEAARDFHSSLKSGALDTAVSKGVHNATSKGDAETAARNQDK